MVDIDGGVVENADLFTQEELEYHKKHKALREQIKALEVEADRQALIAKGREELHRILGDEKFETRPASIRVRVWETFRRKYPDVEPDAPSYHRALDEYRAEQAKLLKAQEQKRAEEEAKANDPGPKPKISGKRIRKLKRAGKWKWGDQEAESKPK